MSRWYLGWLLLIWPFLTTNATQPGQPVAVAQWAVHDIVLTASQPPANPYTDVTLTAVLTGPDRSRRTVLGFWDGGNRFVLRVTLTQPGLWTYETTASDPGLNGQRGQLRCTRPATGAHGFLRRDKEHPYHFVYDDGTHYFMMGQTYYNLLGSATGIRSYRTAVDSSRAYGMNKIRMNVNGVLSEAAVTEPLTEGIGTDFDRLNVAHFQHVDSVIRYMQDRDMIADLILMPRRVLGTSAQEGRYLAYVVARYAAFPNVIWCLINEWNYSTRPKTYWTEAGRWVKAHDPWAMHNGQPRLLSVHQQTRIDFEFFGQDWLSHAIVQYGVRNRQQGAQNEWVKGGKTKYRHGDEWGYASVRHNWGHNLPVVNDEYGYIGEPQDVSEPDTVAMTRQKHRQILWGIVMAGGYASAGDKTKYPGQGPPAGGPSAGGKPYVAGFWHETPEYGDIRRVVNLFTKPGVAYWQMMPDTAVVAGQRRVYARSLPGRQYVVYSADGGTVQLTLPPGRYRTTRYNPATGEQQSEGVVAGGTFPVTLPTGRDWVIVLIAD